MNGVDTQLELPVHGEFDQLPRSLPWSQRWYRGRHSWVREGEGAFDKSRYSVREIPEKDARGFIIRNHYAKSYPAALRRFGMFVDEPSGPDLIGVAVFGIPVQNRVLTNILPDLEPLVASCELSRFIIEGDVLARGGQPGRAPANSESWFLRQCLHTMGRHGYQGIVSFSDPVPRRVGGMLLFPGHYGACYQSGNAIFAGRATARTLIVLPDGTSLSDRAISKLRRGEGDYVIRRIVQLGARPPRGGRPEIWLRGALDEIKAVRLRHPGNYRYVFLTSPAARRSLRLGTVALPYPKPDW